MVNFYNPDPAAAEPKERERNLAIRAQEDAAMRAMTNMRGEDSLSVREREEEGVSPKVPNHHQMTEAQREDNKKHNKNVLTGIFTSKKLRRNGSLATILFTLFGGAMFTTVFFSPSLAIVHMKEVLVSGLNDQMKDVSERSTILLRSKLGDLTNGSCGEIKIKCRFATMSDKQVEKFKAAGIEVERSPETKWYSGKRSAITAMTFTDPSGNQQPLKITDGAGLHAAIMSSDNEAFRAAMLKGYNPLFAGLSDKVSLAVLRGYKATKGLVITGKDDDERRSKVNAAVAYAEDFNAKSITTKTGDDGRTQYFDSDGNEMTKEQVDSAERSGGRISGYIENGGFKNMLFNAVKGANAVAYVDTACTVHNTVRTVFGLSKTIKEAQAVRYATSMVLTPADSIKAGDAKEGEVNFVGNTLAATVPEGKAVDTTQIMLASSSEPIPVTENSEAGMSAYDSPFYKMVAYNEVPDVSLRASQYMLGGTSNVFTDALTIVTKVIAGSADPQNVSEMCGYIQNPVVRLTGLAIGVAAGIGTFGATTALSMGGSLAIGMLLPYAEGQLADIVAGNVFTDITGIDSGDAAVVGSLALFGGIAKKRGSMPLSSQDALQHVAANQQVYSQYAATQQYIARATPFDAANPYSFMGAIASKLVPVAQKSKANASVAMMNIASIIPASFASLMPSAGAADAKPSNYYDQCNDIGYARLGLGANAACGLVYGLKSDLDPLENIDWMVANKEIDPDTGDAIDDGTIGAGVWNYTKFLKECSNRTMGWGENEGENEGDGLNCVSKDNEAKNIHYRTYTFDRSIDESLDGEPMVASGAGGTGISQTKDDTTISTEGWKYPTALDFAITNTFTDSHTGVDIAAASVDKTLGAPVYAAYGGRVMAVDTNTEGVQIIIANGSLVSTVYKNLSTEGVKVKVGDTVKAGDQIAKIGNGSEGTTPHLHFEVWSGSPLNNGKPRDPTEFLDAARKAGEVMNV